MSGPDGDSSSFLARVEGFRRRTAWASFLAEWSLHVAAAAMAASTLALAIRALAGTSRVEVLPLYAVVLVTPVTAYAAARRRFVSDRSAAAWIDVRAGGKGLVVALFETNDGRWSDRIAEGIGRAADFNPVPWRTLSRRLLPSLAFALLTFLVPVSTASPSARGSAVATLDRVDEAFAALAEEIRIEETPAAELLERVEHLRAELAERTPEAQLESLDRLQDAFQAQIDAIHGAGERAMALLAKASEVAHDNPSEAGEALEEAVAALTSAGLDKGRQKGLEDLLKELGPSKDGASPADRPLDPLRVEGISDELRKELAKKLSALRKKGLVKSEAGAKEKPKAKIDWSKFEEHACDPECKEGSS